MKVLENKDETKELMLTKLRLECDVLRLQKEELQNKLREEDMADPEYTLRIRKAANQMGWKLIYQANGTWVLEGKITHKDENGRPIFWEYNEEVRSRTLDIFFEMAKRIKLSPAEKDRLKRGLPQLWQ